MIDNVISIIIPSYNSDVFIEEAINSVIIQTYNDWECIIVDDKSTDNLKGTVNRFLVDYKDKIRLFVNPGKGACSARNYGISKAKGRYLKFLDADDALYDESVLESQLSFITGRKKKSIVFGKEFYYKNSFATDPFKVRGGIVNTETPETFWNNFPITSNFLIDRSSVNKIVWNEKLKSGQEFFLLFELFIDGNSFEYQDKPIVKIRVHDSIDRISNVSSKNFILNSVNIVAELKTAINNKSDVNKNVIDEFYKRTLLLSYLVMGKGAYSACKKIQNEIDFKGNVKIFKRNSLNNILLKINKVDSFFGFLTFKLTNVIINKFRI